MSKLLAAMIAALWVVSAGSAKASDWNGFYLGANAGAAFGDDTSATSTVFSPTGYFAITSPPAIAAAGKKRISPTGFTGGGTAGYNWQSGTFVFGGEADFGLMDLNGSRIGTGTYPCCAPTGFTVKQSVKTDWLFTIRPRLGVADMIPNTLIYATGGLAMTNLNYQAVFTDTFATAHESGGLNRTVVGWTAGAGGEFQVAPHWSIKGEYLYVDFGKSTTHSTNLTAFTPPIAFPSNEWTHSTDLRASIFRVGANYHF